MTRRVEALAAELLAAADGRSRLVVAIAGPPGSGKSTFAEALAAALDAARAGSSAVVPMDGFHLDNAVLDARRLRARKGAPETFDLDGLAATLERVAAAAADVAVPVFDRGLDLARAGGRIVARATPVVLVEGNYLLLRDTGWAELARFFDRTIMMSVPEAELERRLVARWLDHGLAPEAARARALGNDIPNARAVLGRSRPADTVWAQAA